MGFSTLGWETHYDTQAPDELNRYHVPPIFCHPVAIAPDDLSQYHVPDNFCQPVRIAPSEPK